MARPGDEVVARACQLHVRQQRFDLLIRSVIDPKEDLHSREWHESHDRQGWVAELLQEIASVEKVDDLRDGLIVQDRRQRLTADDAVVLAQAQRARNGISVSGACAA
ncbi:hypothetical protein ACFVXE_27945 [Streptomyces sp. NPDC058231]|uniref:hypothetical protein n=1 Tax=Streptomyces sp. NPDC058231 TaxID=3346392 RepID=UPI0036E6000F